MLRKAIIPAALAFSSLSLAAGAAERRVVLDVDNATCELCAPIVQKSLARVSGVKMVKVAQADAMSKVVATVTFDDSETNVPALIAATTNAGYPSHSAD
jgi:mercuric ion binding protein